MSVVESTIFNNNLASLLENHRQLDPAIFSRSSSGQQLEAVATPAGPPTAILAGNYLHSRYDPVREAQKLISREVSKEVSVVIFYGFGLGYLVAAFLEAFPQIPVIVVEPDIPLFLEALRIRDSHGLFASPGVTWFFNSNPEKLNLDNHSLASVQIVKLRSVFSRNISYYRKMDNLIQAAQTKNQVNTNTLNRFGRLWIRNLLNNLEPLASLPGIKLLEDIFSGIPALVLAAGPSLDTLLPILKRLKERLILVAVDTSLKPCLRKGIEPDFLMVMDPQYWNTRHLDGALPESTVLISEPSTNPNVFHHLKVPTFLVSSFFPLGEYLENLTGSKGKIRAGGSVATSAWDFTRLIGADPIYMGALDLGFPQSATHARDTYFEDLRQILSRRLLPAEGMSFHYFHEASPFLYTDNSGRETYTDQRLLIYKWWFEKQLAGIDKQQTFNLSPRGIKIEGMPYYESSNLLNLPVIRPELDSRMIRIRAMAKPDVRAGEKKERLLTALKRLAGDLKELEKITLTGLEECSRLRSQLRENRDVEQTLKRMHNLDSRILELSSRQIAGFLLQPLIEKIGRRNSNQPAAGDVIDITQSLYEELLNSAKYHIQLLSRFI